MEALKVGIREFRERLASYLLDSDVPVAITRHGDTVGYYIPARHKRAETERAALKEAASRPRFLIFNTAGRVVQHTRKTVLRLAALGVRILTWREAMRLLPVGT